jgi:hypothetical protein
MIEYCPYCEKQTATTATEQFGLRTITCQECENYYSIIEDFGVYIKYITKMADDFGNEAALDATLKYNVSKEEFEKHMSYFVPPIV